ncbi:MAG: hypothetical protein LBO74_15180 [Candidatus Symbiothrix sp.]|nr:hypothetical protein [Candidatus Symbiothrix sp.]
MKILNTIIEGISMSKWEMSNLLGGNNNNAVNDCSCKGGTTSNNNNGGENCTCSSKLATYSISNTSIISETYELSRLSVYSSVF